VSHYQTLGVDKSATHADIKKAYRKLSMTHHPDKGGDEDKFKEIADAYNVVGDEKKRQQYDAVSENPFANFQNMGGMEGNFADLFNNAFGGAGGPFRQQQNKGNDIRVQLHISFEEAFYGVTKNFRVGNENITIHIKPGATSGKRLILRGKGSPHPFNSNLPSGDVIIEISVALDHNNIIDPQNNIWREISLPWFDIMTGIKVTISSLDGPLAVMIPKHSQPGKVLRLKNKGWPDYDSGIRGNLMLKLNPSYPDLSEKQLEYIKKVQETQNG
jgi:curved DNA-binding protein|tara:strand:+ start:696 stop:1511 length:816 start_codon:yes stop_codon:yes gene_type:complete